MNKDAFLKIFGNYFRFFQYEEDEPDEAIKKIMTDYYWYRDGNEKDPKIKIREAETVKKIREVVKKGDIVVDVGASIGYFTILLASLVGKTGKVYAIEPTKNQVEYLKENIRINGFEDRVEVHNIAASDFNGEIKIRCNDTSPEIQPCVRLDDILPEKIDFIKMDIEGMELRGLRGLIKTIERNPNLKMTIEYLPQYAEIMGNSIEELDNFINQHFDKKAMLDYNLYLTKKCLSWEKQKKDW